MEWLHTLRQSGFFVLIMGAVLFSLVWAGPATAAWSEIPSEEPILRLETGMHTAPIRRVSVDASGKLLLTASRDKTARLWSLPEGRILQVLRPPVGIGNEGMLYAGALSPNGRIAAVAGWTGYQWKSSWGQSFSIYLFDTTSGRLVYRLAGLPNVILQLSFSPDGQRLAAGLGGSNGIRFWHTTDWQLVGEDHDYNGDCYGLNFDAEGRLATTSWDGYLRLYDAAMQPQVKVKAPAGNRPLGITFSRDGRRVAVGYDDQSKVDVLSGQDLNPLFAMDIVGANKGNLGSVAWSVDGQTLYATGRAPDGQSSTFIRAWPDQGSGSLRNISVNSNTVIDLKALPGGGVVFGTDDPSWGVVQADDRLGPGRNSEIADFRANQDSFKLSQDGTRVAFSLDRLGKRPASFSIIDRQLTLGSTSIPGLTAPSTAAPGLIVSDWKNTAAPRLNGRELQLERNGISRAAAVQGDRLLLGTDWSLRLFNQAGTQLWEKQVPATAWAVNFSGNGRLAVAAYGDGTIRWHRASDGQELLALLPHKDGQRWIAWTPEGYYDASAGAEDLIGWHVNSRDLAFTKASSFFPASRFRDRFYSPGVVAQVLDTLNVDEAVSLASLRPAPAPAELRHRLAEQQQELNPEARRPFDIAEELRQPDALAKRQLRAPSVHDTLPPTVEILDPPDSTIRVRDPKLTLTFLVKSPTAPLRHTKALIDGRPVEPLSPLTTPRMVEQGTYAGNFTIPLPTRDAEISVIAEDQQGSSSEPAKIRIAWDGQISRPKPNLYVLAVGVTRYKDPLPGINNLNFPAKDAKDMAAALKTQEGRLYGTVTVQLLPDGKATREAIMEGLLWIKRQTTQQDVAAVFLAGHGRKDEEGHYLFLPHDADQNKLELTTVRDTDLQRMLGGIPGKVLFFVDTCYSGAFSHGIRADDTQPDIDRLANELASAETGAIVFASSTGRQVSIEDERWSNGAFTKALLEGLRGKADLNRERAVRVNGLASYLANRVKELTGGKQMPVMVAPKTAIEDFPIVAVP